MALNRNKPRVYSTVTRHNSLQLAAATAVFEGAAIGIDSSNGRVRALVAGDLFAGFAASAASSAKDVTGAAPTPVRLLSDGEVQLAVPGVTATSIGDSVFATDDDTFALTGSSLVGEVVRVPAAGQAVVAFVGGVKRLSSAQVDSSQALVSGAGIGPLTISAPTGYVLGATLTATTTPGWVVGGYQWTRDGADIAGATSSTYTLTLADVQMPHLPPRVIGCRPSAPVYTYLATVPVGAFPDGYLSLDGGVLSLDGGVLSLV